MYLEIFALYGVQRSVTDVDLCRTMLKFSLAEIGPCGSYTGPQYDYRIEVISRGQNIRGGQVIFSQFVDIIFVVAACTAGKVGRSLHSWVKYSRFNHKNHEYFNCPPLRKLPAISNTTVPSL